jgi:Bacterial self-protective colicin-like immunity
MLSREEALAVASPWWDSWIPALQPYAILLRLFIDGVVEAPEFEVLFLRLYKSDRTDWPEDIFSILDAFFADVDEYCADAALRARVNGIDAGELRARAVRAFQRLKALGG